MKLNKLKWFDYLLLSLIFIIAGGLRTYRLKAPLADWHSWRQADTASVAREYVKHGIDLLHPRYHDLSSIPSGKDNFEGYRFVEFPILNALHAWLYLHFPQIDFVVWGRLITIFLSSSTAVILYLLVYFLNDRLTASLTAGLFAVLPYNLFYGRVILPEPGLVFFSFLAILLFVVWLSRKSWFWYSLSLLSFSLALLLKPTALAFLLPLGLYLWPFTKLSLKEKILVFFYPFIAVLPLLAWRWWMQQFPQGIPASAWLFNSNHIRFKGSYFYWIFGERIGRLILGYWNLIPVGLGLFLLSFKSRSSRLWSGIVLAALSFLVIIATGNVQHDYYQIQIIPALTILYGLGGSYLVRLRRGWGRFYTFILFIFVTLLGLALGWYQVRGYFNINNPAIVHAGQKLDQLVPPDALVIAPYMGDTAFLFQTNRRGWPIGGDIDFKIKHGASYYVTTTKDKEYRDLKAKYPVIFENDEFAILKLKP